MTNTVRYVFKIDGKYTIETLPMERLAEYMGRLAAMLGEPDKVHFLELVEGSVGLVHAIEREASPIVENRIEAIRRGTADVAYMDAYRSLNKKLREDDSHGQFFPEGRAAEVLRFPGSLAPEVVAISGVPHTGSIDGTIIRVGGKSQEIPVTVMSGETPYRCVTTKPLAKELAKHLFEGELRLYGHGRWCRDENGSWKLQRFVIEHYEPLDTTPLSKVFDELRAIPDAEWHKSKDLWQDAFDIRSGKPH